MWDTGEIPRTWSSSLAHNHAGQKESLLLRSCWALLDPHTRPTDKREKEKEDAEIARRPKEMDALKAKNASLLEKETALNEREKELREKLEGVGQLRLLMETASWRVQSKAVIELA